MQKLIVTANEAEQRLDRFLHKYLPAAGNDFIHKMLRLKNITLNGKRAGGEERISVGDEITLFISDETLQKFHGRGHEPEDYLAAFRRLEPIRILLENEHILAVDKPVGVLSQKAARDDMSLNEWLIGYLLTHGAIDAGQLDTFRPSILQRLDRNTGGIILCGKTLAASQEISRLFRMAAIDRYYLLAVAGRITVAGEWRGYLKKNRQGNTVKMTGELPPVDSDGGKSVPVITRYKPLHVCPGLVEDSHVTLIEAELVTGKTHQIRAQFAAAGHPIIGDAKYGDQTLNEAYKSAYGIDS